RGRCRAPSLRGHASGDGEEVSQETRCQQVTRLRRCSPAIDAGDNTDAPNWDQRGSGYPRIVGILDPDNPIIDIGAYGVQAELAAPVRMVALFSAPHKYGSGLLTEPVNFAVFERP